MGYFEVDRKGLAKQFEKFGKAFIVLELLSNSWDENVEEVHVELTPIEGRRGVSMIVVEDDSPEGFKNLSHAYTLYAESYKTSKPESRGRFNAGEKYVLALCDYAKISSTTGTVIFENDDRRTTREKRDRGTRFEGIVKVNAQERDEVEAVVKQLIPPKGVKTYWNGTLLLPKTPVHSFEMTLPTVLADEEGDLHPTRRKTTVRLFKVAEGDTPRLYELGIPVVELDGGDAYSIDVGQKAPVTRDRKNVTPAFLKQLRTEVLNQVAELLDDEDTTQTWVDGALEDKNVTAEAVKHIITARYGEDAVVYDPSDREANDLAASEGRKVIPPRAFNKEQWENIRKADFVKPAGQVTPSQTVKSGKLGKYSPLPEDKLTTSMQKMIDYATDLAQELMDLKVTVQIVDASNEPYLACYGGQTLTFNAGTLTAKWFDRSVIDPKVNDLLIHEYAHEYESNHLNKGYHDALSLLGAKLAKLAFENPGFFSSKGAKRLTAEQLAKKP